MKIQSSLWKFKHEKHDAKISQTFKKWTPEKLILLKRMMGKMLILSVNRKKREFYQRIAEKLNIWQRNVKGRDIRQRIEKKS